MTTGEIRFCAVDDHDIVLYGVAAMAAQERDIVYCGGASDAHGAINLIVSERPNIMLLDLRLGRVNSFDLCEELTSRQPNLAIVMFTAFGNEDLLQRAIRSGAVGYLLKDTSTAGLPSVLRTVHKDGAFFDPRIANQALISGRTRVPRASLSDRELSLLRLVAEGKDNLAIADQLHLSVHMVKFHISQLLKRYEVHRRAELVRVLMERQILP